jgi:hypothetical protein
MFRAERLKACHAHVAFPLVACNYPALSLQLWTDFVRKAEANQCGDRLMGLIDARGLHHAIFGYRVVEGDPETSLNVTHIATFQLAGDAVSRAFYEALEGLARDNGCRKVVIDPWVSQEMGVDAARAPKSTTLRKHILCISPPHAMAQTLN